MRDGIVREGRASTDYLGRPSATDTPSGIVRTVHPLVRRHHESGEESVYISCGNVEHMEAPADETHPAVWLDTAESYKLVRALVGEVTAPPLVWAHNWRVGDFAIWDNRLLLHAPCKHPGTVGERLHHRVRLDGSAAANKCGRP